MADITRDTFDKTKNYALVVHQKGRVLVDNEFNEQGSALFAQAVEAGTDAAGTMRATDDDFIYRPTASGYGAGWRPMALGTATIYLLAGDVWVDGFQLTLDTNLDLTAVGLTFPVVGGSPIFGFIYAEAVLTEVDETVDANLSTPQVGQTAIRRKVDVTFYQAEGTTSFEATFAAIPALPAATNPRLWAGNKARFFLGRYYRAAADTVVAANDVVDLRGPTPGSAYATTHRFIKTYRNASGDTTDGVVDGAVMWNAAAGKLQIGKYHAGTNEQKRMAGAMVRNAGPGITHQFTKHSAAAPATPDLTNSWLIADGEALGYSSYASCMSHTVAGGSYAHDTTPALSAPVKADILRVQKLVVQDLSLFFGNPSEFVLCTRVGRDLIWHNGQVTRGEAGTNNFVFPDIGDHPSEWKAVLSTQGAGHATGADALQRVMNHSTHAAGLGAIVTTTEKRNMRFFLKAGAYTISGAASDTPYKYGTIPDDYGGHIYLQGDSRASTTITVDAPATTGARNATTQRASLHLSANKVTLKDLGFIHTLTGGGPASAILEIVAKEVEIENCAFDAPVIIFANVVRVNGCVWTPTATSDWDVSNGGKRMFHAKVWAGGAHLELAPYDATGAIGHHLITGNTFYCRNAFGCSSSVKLMDDPSTAFGYVQSPRMLFELSGNTWNYDTTPSEQWSQYPAISIPGTCSSANVLISKNRFTGHTGCSKLGGRGTGGAADERFPWPTAGYRYRADVLEDWANNVDSTDGTSTDGDRITACAYVSITGNRVLSSLCTIEDNYFDLSTVGGGLISTTTHLYSVAGACIIAQNDVTAGASTKQVNNVRFMRNTINMVSADGDYANTTATGGIPFVFGFLATPGWSTCDGAQAIRYRSIHVTHNSFFWRDPSTDNNTWRGFLTSDPVGVADTSNRMFATPAMISLTLKNGSYGAGVSNDYRTMSDIVIDCNSMTEEEQYATGQYLWEQITLLGTSAAPYTCAQFINVDGGFAPYSTFTLTEGGGGAVTHVSSAGVYNPRVLGNSIAAPVFAGSAAAVNWGILLNNCWRGQVTGNTVILSEDTGSLVCITAAAGRRNCITANSVQGRTGINTTANDYISDNLALLCGTANIAGGGVVAFTTASNFA